MIKVVNIRKDRIDSLIRRIYDKNNQVVDTGDNSTTFWLNYPGYKQEYKFRLNNSINLITNKKKTIGSTIMRQMWDK